MFEFKSGYYNIEVYMSWVDDIDIMTIRNSNEFFSNRCCKIWVVSLARDFYPIN